MRNWEAIGRPLWICVNFDTQADTKAWLGTNDLRLVLGLSQIVD